MGLNYEKRESDSPFVEQVWRSRSENINKFISVAVTQWELAICRQAGKLSLHLRGPETQATAADVPEDAEFFGITFKTGTFMPHLPVSKLLNENIQLPEASGNSFWFKSSTWELPNFDNAESFVKRLVHEELLVHEPVVNDVLRGYEPDLSLRSVQRRFLNITGMTQSTIHQIERARHAATLLRQGVSILDTVFEAGYFDQPHLTRSLKHYIGQTPAQLQDQINRQELSL
jgi:hypothetical protein